MFCLIQLLYLPLPTAPMHRSYLTQSVLYNMEILREIIVYVHDSTEEPARWGGAWGESGDKASLAKLARVCKVFHDPALDQLWQSIAAFTAIFHLWNAIAIPCTSAVNMEPLPE